MNAFLSFRLALFREERLQQEMAVNKFTQDPFSRQAMLDLWRSPFGLSVDHSHLPYSRTQNATLIATLITTATNCWTAKSRLYRKNTP